MPDEFNAKTRREQREERKKQTKIKKKRPAKQGV